MKSLSTLVLVCCGLSFVGCSGSSNPPPLGTAQDLQGFWKVWTVESGGELGPAALFLSVSGSTVSGADVTGTVNGSTFQFTASVFDGMTTVNGILTTAITASGTYEITKTNGSKVNGTFRMLKFTPSGSLSVTGSIIGETVTHTTNTAVGIRKFIDLARLSLAEVEIVTGSADLSFELDFSPANLALGTLTVGTGAADVGVAVEFSTGTASARAVAVGGSIQITRYDPAGFAATFLFNLDTGDTVTGTFDVKFDIDAFHPSGP